MCADELSGSGLIAAVLGATPGESLEDAARRVVAEREQARKDKHFFIERNNRLSQQYARAGNWSRAWKQTATKYWIECWRLRGIVKGERARREDVEQALMRAHAEIERLQHSNDTWQEQDDMQMRGGTSE